MRKLKLMALAGVVVSTLGIGHVYAAAGAGPLEQTPIDDKSDVYGRGMERIDRWAARYYCWSVEGGWYPIPFFRINKDSPDPFRTHPRHRGFEVYKAEGDDRAVFPKENCSRTLTGDIRDAFLDQTKFDLALMEDRYFEAWAMAEPNEQGELWKRMAAAGAKKKCKELGMESFLLEASDPTESRALAEKAGSIFTSFPEGNPLREELRAQFERGKRLATPPAPGVEAELAVHRGIIARLLEE